MSYDIYLVCDCCDQVISEWNYTFNVYEQLKFSFQDSEHFKAFHKKPASECVEQLARAVERIQAHEHRETLKAMDPPNKWGSLEGVTGVLVEFLAKCRKHPTAIIEVSC